MDTVNVAFAFRYSTLIVPVQTELDPDQEPEALIDQAARIALHEDGIDCSHASAEVGI